MINLRKKFKSFGPLEILVITSVIYVLVMLIWTATTRKGVLEKVNDIKSNHTNVVELLNNEINRLAN
jgi:cell shape-determining protein MreC